ncbi:hypothetical protein FNH22_00380 [Fulvivirga sp. M361]|uniref:right-handed parallel beta-helix repeat-containing protein n=1 Tax=Fulvivirga sp. M361 TaxID=2594266 RepID=UPI00117BC16B|nr:right-handed parallel beta-helix repeat-containing protein [Fulvivirga sp. M361]TRX62586.1 hypothetical protein FNH22_00380 [Fulvivirga sp. M361]
MKQPLHFLLVSIVWLTISCGEDDDPSITETINQDQPENIITTPCDFDLSQINANSSVIIDCVLDLQQETVNLPDNVNFEFEGGDVINGKLVFSGGTIDGRLLSSKLEVEGDVTLKDPTFKFYAIRWDVKEGITTSDIAFQNTATLEKVMFMTKKLGATTFTIDKFDAYFEVTRVTSTSNLNFYPSLEAVNIPSDFNLVMTENTHLRIFPADTHEREGGGILAVRDAANITVTGGTLHGDRDERVYSPDDNGLEGSHLFLIHSGRNITIESMTFENGSKGTFSIASFGFSFNPDYNPTTRVTIKNCMIKDSRRMAIALTDGRDILIEGNTFINTGQPSANSDGGEVGYAINIEPVRTRDAEGDLKEYQKVFDVLIKGNTETNSRGGFVTLTIGQDITVEDNDIGSRAVYSLVSGAKIINNRFKASGKAEESWAIFAAGSGPTVFNNEIAGNTIEGYSLGIATSSYDAFVHDNTIKDCGGGLQISKAFNSRFYNNKIDVSGNGIMATNTYNDNIEVKGNEVTSGSFHVYFVQINNKEGQEDYSMLLDDNTFKGTRKASFSNANGLIFKNNDVTGGIEMGNLTRVTLSGNTVRPNESSGIRLYNSHESVSIMDNTIYEPTGAERFKCIQNDSSTPAGLTISLNTCN